MPSKPTPHHLAAIHAAVAACRRCPRLVTWREDVARERVRRFADQEYWGKAVPGFGDPQARLLIVGLAPAAHGANRTGRMFTGDRSGDWLFRALHKAGFANQPTSLHREDGLALSDCYIAAAARCAPPDNKPLPEEFANCRPFLLDEIRLLRQLQVVIGLGLHGFTAALGALEEVHSFRHTPRPKFGHGAEVALPRAGTTGILLLGSFHPSQQNTFTGRLTEPMFDAVFDRARQALGSGGSGNPDSA